MQQIVQHRIDDPVQKLRYDAYATALAIMGFLAVLVVAVSLVVTMLVALGATFEWIWR